MPRSHNPAILASLVAALGIAWVISLRVPVIAPIADSAPTVSDPTAIKPTTQSAAKTQAKSLKSDPFWPPIEPPKPVVVQITSIAPLPPPKPTLPFKFFGRMTNPDGRQSIFVSRDNEQYEMKPNAMLEGSFKVVSISDTTIVFEHIASGEKLEMALPAIPKNSSGSGS